MALLSTTEIKKAKAWLHDVFIWGGWASTPQRTVPIENYRYMYGTHDENFRKDDPKYQDAAKTICEIKMNDTFISLFILAIFCGLLMFIAVDGYKKCNNPVILVFCVAVFILCGFEHSIADMAYYFIAGMFNVDALFRIAVISIGNGVGGVLIPLLKMEK